MSLAERLQRGDTVLTAWSLIAANPVVDTLARSDFDAVTLDMQHGAHHEASVFEGLGTITAQRMGAIVRIPVGRNDMASRALDFGAEAVIAPMINSVSDAVAFAAAMKYPPVGERSWGPGRAMQIQGVTDGNAFLHKANAGTLAFAMIETRAALAVLDEILEVEGIDGVFVGPSDFSISWTDGARIDPHITDLEETLAQVASKAKARGKLTGIFVFDPARAAHYVEMGYQLLAITTDTSYLAEGIDAALASARGGKDTATAP